MQEIKNGIDRTHLNNSKENKYVQSVKWNGLPLSEPRFSHQMLASGGVLEFEMGKEPNKELFKTY